MYKYIGFSLVMVLLRVFWVYWVPFGNDEAYYWDWSRDLMLSYYDHPPMVAWIGKLGTLLLGEYSYNSRFFVPILHFCTSVLLYFITADLLQKKLDQAQSTVLFFMIQFAPIFSWGGVFLLPDIGLVFWILLAVFFGLKILQSRRTSWNMFVGWGLAAGMALNSKYHAFMMLPPLFMYVWVKSYRRHQTRNFLGALITALVVSSPVWVWNSQNNWISFSFQAAHGFSGLKADFPRGFRLVLAQFLLVSPYVFVHFFRSALKVHRRDHGSLLKWVSLPLLVLLSCLAFFKEVLPHWILPSYIVCIPLIVLQVKSVSQFCRVNFLVFGGLSLLVPFLAGSTLTTDYLSKEWMHSKPKGLGEITLWKKVKPVLGPAIENHLASADHCPQKIMLGSLRWWWTAQLSAVYPDHQVFNFDRKMSYYDFRDQQKRRDYRGCKIILLGQKKHYSAKRLAKFLEIHEELDVSFPLHDDRDSILVKATIL